MLHEVRESLLDEARLSPNLLADLAGLEAYVAESYDSRSFVELLQNADDAGAKRFAVVRRENFLYVANDGRAFSRQDFESLCRSAASTKKRGDNIGYRGIGFKSVVSFARKVLLFSDSLAASFSHAQTKFALPEAARVPLIRIPHPVQEEDRRLCDPVVQLLKGKGLTTVFVFSDLVAQSIETEFAAFDDTSLLFLRNIQRMMLRGFDEADVTVSRSPTRNGESRVTLTGNDESSNWVILDSKKISLAFLLSSVGPVRLTDDRAVVHAFLPTNEKTGLGVKVNGDLSTDPSRTRIVLDDRTAACVNETADAALRVVRDALGATADQFTKGALRAIVPGTDPRLAAYLRPSFEKSLLLSLMERGKDQFAKQRIRPSWFRNGTDFEKVAEASGICFLSIALEEIDGVVTLLRSLGAAEASLEELSAGMSLFGVSESGAADVLERFAILHSTGQLTTNEIDENWKIWPVARGIETLRGLRAKPEPISSRCLDIVREHLGTLSSFRNLLDSVCDLETANGLMPQEKVSGRDLVITVNDQTIASGNGIRFTATKGLRLTKWRTAEQYVLDFLGAQGWHIQDVSRQNLGYDIAAKRSDGEEYCVEVKSITSVGDCFTLTSNEEVVARQKGDLYLLAIVHHAGTQVEIAFIADPTNKLNLIRQCRQWAWVCDEYPFAPERVDLS